MSDSAIVSRFNARPGAAELERVSEESICDDIGCFGWLRGLRERAVMLELRRKNGNILAVSYAWLERAEFDPSDGIVLHLGGQRVRIKGKYLNAEVRPMVRLYEGITRHRVLWVQEADEPAFVEAEPGATLIEGIDW